MTAIQDGDAESLRELYRRYKNRAFGICVRVLGNQHDAEEVLLDIFQEIWSRADRFDAKRSSVKTYVLLLARSRSIDRLRVRKRSEELTPDMMSDLTSVSVPESDSEVSLAVRKLDATYQQVLQLSFFDGYSHSQIADKLQLPLGTVKTRIRTAITTLRQKLNPADSSGKPLSIQ
ncbi:MAG: RNA polymerase sigma factor [Planctomycetaceae bacterium]